MNDEEIDKKDNNNLEIKEEEEFLDIEYTEEGAEDIKKKFKKLKEDLNICRKEKYELNATNIEYLTGWQKERAEFANYKKQEENRKTMHSESTRERILIRFLTVLDSFNMAFTNKEAWSNVDENWRKGVEYIYAQMNTVFEEYGVKAIGEVGELFDPNVHQSIEMIETNKKEDDHKVALIIQKGYKLGERILRPARVNVYEYKE
ncbi:MAG: nucleotide exchange factor GrpE [Patescibacteria group bacterium]